MIIVPNSKVLSEMLPVLLFNNMEGSSNSLNNNGNSSFGHSYEESVILNSVRSRKKVSESASCPVCSCTIRQGELESHLNLELERLFKLSNGGSKRKLSVNSSGSNLNPLPGSSTEEVPDDQEIDVSGCPGSDVYQVFSLTNREICVFTDIRCVYKYKNILLTGCKRLFYMFKVSSSQRTSLRKQYAAR